MVKNPGIPRTASLRITSIVHFLPESGETRAGN